MTNAPRDENQVPVLMLEDDVTGLPVPAKADTDGNLLAVMAGGGGSGTVTTVSVVSANGFAGSVANATTTPAITLSTTITGILSGNGTAISAAATTGSGSVVLATSPTLVTPVLGVATATSINKVAFTAPATGSTITIANGKTFTSSNTLTLTGTDGSSVAFGTGGTVAYTNVTTLSSLVSVGTITTGTWNGTDIAVADGGTGLSSTTAYAVLCGGTTSTAPLQSIAGVGTAGQVLTSNGAGALPTFQAASSGVGDWVIPYTGENVNTQGTAPIQDLPSWAGSTAAGSGVTSAIYLSNNAADATFLLWDYNPRFMSWFQYTAGSATGDGTAWLGFCLASGGGPTRTQTAKSAFFLVETVAGTATLYAVSANGTTNNNTSIAGITLTDNNKYEIIVANATTVKFYINGTLKVTHSSNVPTGAPASPAWSSIGVDNATADTTTRSFRAGYAMAKMDMSA